MHRRYKIGTHKAYDDTYDHAKMASAIFNTGKGMPSAYSINISDKAGIESMIRTLEGNEEGEYFTPDSGKWWTAKIPVMEKELVDIAEKFKQHQQSKINSGREMPSEMPSEMLSEKHEAEAKLDVYTSELEFLQKKLKTFTDVDEKKSAALVLKHWPKGSSRLRGGIIAEVDGQDCAVNKEGWLIINDPRSKYDGLTTEDYFAKVVKPYGIARMALRRETQRQLKDGEIQQWDVKFNAKPPLPSWPEGCINHHTDKTKKDKAGRVQSTVPKKRPSILNM